MKKKRALANSRWDGSLDKAQGWTCVSISRFQDNNHAVDITMWLEENVKNYERNGRDFIFENSKDATMFILRWS